MKFLRNLLAVIVGLTIFTFIAILILMGLISSASEDKQVTVKDNTVLRLKLNKPITERELEDPFADLPFPGSPPSSIGLIQLRDAISHAKNDDKIKGIYIEAPWVMGGFSQIEEIRNVLNDFKTSGKFVWAYSDFFTEGGYYLSSVADEIYVEPIGNIEFNGISAQLTFLKGTMEKLEIEPLIFRVGKYKSAVETFLREDMSDENREQIEELVEAIFNLVTSSISDSRNINVEELREINNKMLVRSVNDAVKYKLIDGLLYKDEFLSKLKEKIDIDEEDELEFISYSRYRKSYKENTSANRIAVIVADGDIVLGKGEQGMVGSEVFAEEIQKARENDRVKAVVLRINSPGGHRLASDIIWREIQKTTEVKPVVASMSSVAASGGYYIAMASDTIVANPTTITGSIGIYWMFFNISEFMSNKLGITFDGTKSGEFSDILSGTRTLTEVERAIMQKQVNRGYEAFISKAAEGRSMQVEDIDNIAAGRVWTGDKAKELGLVDILGDFDKAIQVAAQMADIEDYKLRFYPVQKNLLEEIMFQFEEDAAAKTMRNELGEFYPYVKLIKRMKYMEGLQTRMPYDINIK